MVKVGTLMRFSGAGVGQLCVALLLNDFLGGYQGGSSKSTRETISPFFTRSTTYFSYIDAYPKFTNSFNFPLAITSIPECQSARIGGFLSWNCVLRSTSLGLLHCLSIIFSRKS